MVTLVLEVVVYIEVVQKLDINVQIRCLSRLCTEYVLTRRMGPWSAARPERTAMWPDFFKKKARLAGAGAGNSYARLIAASSHSFA